MPESDTPEQWALSALTGFRVVASAMLAGGKRGIISGRCVYVSPAMSSLMNGADSAELERLFRSIEWVQIPDLEAIPTLDFCGGKYG